MIPPTRREARGANAEKKASSLQVPHFKNKFIFFLDTLERL